MTFQRGQPRPSNAGRRAGTPNRASSDFREKVLRSGLSPVDFLCQTFRDPEQPMHLRVDAAKSIIPYIYPKLSNVDIHTAGDQPLVVQVLRFAELSVEERRPTAIAAPPVIDMALVAAESAVIDAAAVPITAAEGADGDDAEADGC
jgi:hypothetical protein